MRRILFILVLGLILAGVAFTLFNLERREGLSRSVYEAVSKESSFILDFKSPRSFARKIKENNLLYDEFQSLTAFGEIQAFQMALDSMIREVESLHLLSSSRMICAAEAKEKRLEWSFFLPILPEFSESEIVDYLLEINPEAKPDELFIQISNLPRLEIGIRDRILIVSKRRKDVQTALSNIDQGLGLGKDPNFNRVFQSSGKNKSLNIYAKSQLAMEFLNEYFEISDDESQPFGSWLELDLILKTNSIQLDGLSQQENNLSSSSPHNVKDFFNGIPKRINSMWSSSLNFDFDSAGLDLQDSLEFNYHLKWSEQIKALCAPAYMSFEFYPAKDGDIERVDVVSIKDPLAFGSFLAQLESLDSSSFTTALACTTQHALLWSKTLDIDSCHPMLLLNKNFLYFVRNEGIARKLMQNLENNKLLSKDDYFMRFSENMMTEAKSTRYWAPFRNRDLNSKRNSEELQALLNEYQVSINKLEGVSWQYGLEGKDAHFHHVFVKYNPSIEEERNTLWEFEMKHRLAMKPQTFVNHYSGAKELLVQDSSKTLYLINNKGKLLWKRTLDGFILGEIQMVDKFKNNKFQILFNTENEIYLLDRKGRNVDDFPVKYEAGFTSPLQVVDYDDNKNYRILVAGKDSSVMNYDLSAKKVRGWSYKKTKYSVDAQIQYTQIKSKDYIVCHTSEGKFIALNRKGEVRLKFSQKNVRGENGTWAIQKGSDLKKSFILAVDSAGSVWKIRFKGSNNKLGQIPASSLLNIGNMDEDKYSELFFGDSLGLAYMDQGGSKETILSSGTGSKVLDASLVGAYGAVLKIDQEVQLLKNGKFIEYDSDLQSNQLPLLLDLNGDKELEIILGLGNQLYCFPLSN